jgi:hypothetical protein
MTPLYLGRTATFVLETDGLTTREAEQRIEQLCEAFEGRKRYLIERWWSAGNESLLRGDRADRQGGHDE